jgi:Flp pilus assembly protein TadD
MRSFVAACLVAACAAAVPASAQTVRPIDPRTRELALERHREGWQFLTNEDFEGAREAFSKAIELVPSMPTAHYGLGKSYMGLKQYAQAVSAFSACRDAYQAVYAGQALDDLARSQQRQDQMRELQAAVRESQSTNTRTQNSSARSRTLRELQDQMRYLSNDIGSGRHMDPELTVPPEVYLALGSAHFRAEHMRDAEAQYRLAVKVKPDFGEALNNLAVICLLTDRPDEAGDFVTRAEKAGFRVHPDLKDDIKAKRKR